jgi:hypothetical protein
MVDSGYSKNRILRLSFGLDGFLSDLDRWFLWTGSVISFGLDISNIDSFIHSR